MDRLGVEPTRRGVRRLAPERVRRSPWMPDSGARFAPRPAKTEGRRTEGSRALASGCIAASAPCEQARAVEGGQDCVTKGRATRCCLRGRNEDAPEAGRRTARWRGASVPGACRGRAPGGSAIAARCRGEFIDRDQDRLASSGGGILIRFMLSPFPPLSTESHLRTFSRHRPMSHDSDRVGRIELSRSRASAAPESTWRIAATRCEDVRHGRAMHFRSGRRSAIASVRFTASHATFSSSRAKFPVDGRLGFGRSRSRLGATEPGRRGFGSEVEVFAIGDGTDG